MLFLTSLVLLVVFVAGYLIYNVYFHPLSVYPGPRWWAATHFPRIKALATGQMSYAVLALHEEYGDVVRIAPNELSYINGQGWKDIYGHRQGLPQLPKDPALYQAQPNGYHSIVTANNVDHTRYRRLLSHAFSEKAMRDQEPLIKGYVDLLMQRLSEHAGEKVDMLLWLNLTAFDLIGDLTFGEPFYCLRDSKIHPWITIIFDSVKAGVIFTSVFIFPGGQRLLGALAPRELIKKRDYHQAYVDKATMARLQRKTDRPDFMSAILRHNDERGMSDGEICATANALITAGSETTATLLAAVMYQLVKNPAAYAKLAEEVHGAFESESEIDFTSVSNLPYMLAVLKEGMRIFPPIPSSLPRQVTAEGAMINGQWVAPYTLVGVNQLAAYRISRNFRDPDKFVPERWLDDERYASDKKDCFQPFSTGPRNCVGKNLAYAEMRLVLARIIWNFKTFDLTEESKTWGEGQEHYIIWQKPALMMTYAKRAACNRTGDVEA